MKKNLLYWVLWGVLLLAGCWSSLTVVEYNDSFIKVVNDCLSATQPFWDEFEWWNTDLATLQDDIQICKKAWKDASNLWNFDWDSSLKEAVINFLWTYTDYLEKFTETSPYRNIDNISTEDEDYYRNLRQELASLENDLNAQMSSLQEVQESFAAKHGLKLQ